MLGDIFRNGMNCFCADFHLHTIILIKHDRIWRNRIEKRFL
jgi:hypothetical protein